MDGWLSSNGSGCRERGHRSKTLPSLAPMGVRLFVEQFMVDVPCTTFRTREDNAILLARRARQRIMKSHPWSPLSALSLSLSLCCVILNWGSHCTDCIMSNKVTRLVFVPSLRNNHPTFPSGALTNGQKKGSLHTLVQSKRKWFQLLWP